MNTMSFYEFRSEQIGSGSRSYIFKEKTKQYEKCLNAYKIRKSVLLD